MTKKYEEVATLDGYKVVQTGVEYQDNLENVDLTMLTYSETSIYEDERISAVLESRKLQEKPGAASMFVTHFRCKGCEKPLRVVENFAEYWDTGDGDCLDYNCPHCGEYYKKTSRIPQELVTESYYLEC